MKRTNWIDAREAANKTQRDVDFWMRVRIPDLHAHLRIDQVKLSRFEKGGSARVDPATLALLAECYGQALANIDEAASEAFREVRDLVASLSGWITTTPDDLVYEAA